MTNVRIQLLTTVLVAYYCHTTEKSLERPVPLRRHLVSGRYTGQTRARCRFTV